jgi:hypothetical protein
MKTKEQLTKEISNYLEKTSEHLFYDGKNYLKVMYNKGENRYTVIFFQADGKPKHYSSEVLSDSRYNSSKNNSLDLLSKHLFQGNNYKSIKQSKANKELFKQLAQVLNTNDAIDKLIEDIQLNIKNWVLENNQKISA